MKKGDVNGPDAQPIFEYLKAQAPTEEYNGLKAKAAKTPLGNKAHLARNKRGT